MKRIQDFGDRRNKGWCVFCGGPGQTRDHVPSLVLLDEPYPTDLPVVPACAECNASFSSDEAYFACLIECALTGSVENAKGRSKIDGILTRSPGLASRLRAAQYQREGETGFTPETDRVQAIFFKLARGHAAFENNEPRIDEPASIQVAPFTRMNEQDRMRFESGTGPAGVSPEVGSRAMTRLIGGHDLTSDGWVDVQSSRYRYRVEWTDGFRVQMVIREYLTAEVAWT